MSGQAILNFDRYQISRPSLDKDGTKRGNLYFGLLKDLAKAISNFLLERQAKNVLELIKEEEAEVRARINVISDKD